jgi:hypothetical protein
MLVDVAHMDSAALGLIPSAAGGSSGSSGSNNIIVDEFDTLWSYLTTAAKKRNPGGDESSAAPITSSLLPRVDIILDNAGLELYTDLVLADYLVESGLVGT